MAVAVNLGFPRLGPKREWKKACESYWTGRSSAAELHAAADRLMRWNWNLQAQAGIDVIPVNDFAYYDHVLDAAAMVGAVPPRYGLADDAEVDVDTYFAMARGRQDAHRDVIPMEMTKWFDTNYHYIVPEFWRGMKFRLASRWVFERLDAALAAGVKTPRPVLVGPVTFLLLGKTVEPGVQRSDLLEGLLEVYDEVLGELKRRGALWVQMDEPVLVTDLDELTRELFRETYRRLTSLPERPRLMVATYFGSLGDNFSLALELGTEGLHLDLVRGPDQARTVMDHSSELPVLSLGVIDGRNVWRTDLDAALELLRPIARKVGCDRLQVAPSCSLLHCPIDLEAETEMDPSLREWLAFGKQKLEETAALVKVLHGGEEAAAEILAETRAALGRRRQSRRVHRPEVQALLKQLTPEMLHRKSPFPERRKLQAPRLNLPELPTTTIGSFPQTGVVRKLRADYKSGRINEVQYRRALEDEVIGAIRFQEEIGLDVLVHGEFERSDMVEYFGEMLDGFIFTANGWVQSYGSRAVKPPIIYGDVVRRIPMTVAWSKFAQSQTARPIKGMVTGPVTLLQWSFVRDDQPRELTCRQLALAIRDEVLDLEAAGLKVIQIDEPALREGLPLRRSQWAEYLDWAVGCFRLASSGVRDETQIHTHMCYSEFQDIITAIAAMDADVISIEASRSRMELLQVFRQFQYPNAIGPGVYDIHSPRVPSQAEMEDLLQKALEVVPRDRLWVNPDCGLKTRDWAEVKPALANMVAAARAVRKQHEGVQTV